VSISQILDHADRAKARLTSLWAGKPNLEALLDVFSAQVQDLEDALWGVYADRALATATGAQLDVLGSILGQPRTSANDDEYRAVLLARIAALISDGAVEQLVRVVRLLASTATSIEFMDEPPAGFCIRVHGFIFTAFLAALTARYIKRARGGGIGACLTYEASAGPYFSHSIGAYVDGVLTTGADEIFVLAGVGALDQFPVYGGTIRLDEGTPDEENLVYTFFDSSAPKFLVPTLVANNHDDHTTVRLLRDGDPIVGYPTELTYLNGLHTAGAGTLTVDDTSAFPASGDLVIDEKTLDEEVVTYTSKTGTVFTLSGTLANTHADNTTVALVDADGGEYLGVLGA
jgi:hypothetical protein